MAQANSLIAAGGVLLGTSAGIEIVTDTVDSETSLYQHVPRGTEPSGRVELRPHSATGARPHR